MLEGYQRTLPADHLDLLRARLNLAATISMQGDLESACELQEAVLEVYDHSLPEDHPDLLTARLNLAVTMSTQGDLEGARDLKEAVVEAYQRTLPANHPDLLTARGNLANTMRQWGDIAGARQLQEAVLEGFERSLPADHPYLLTARLNLAVTMSMQGDLAGARDLKEAVVEAYQRTLPAHHPYLLIARLFLASTMRHQSDLAGARDLEEAVVEVYQRTLPTNHPALLTAFGRLASTMRHQGDLAGARQLQEAVLEGIERSLPAHHPDLLAARGNLAKTAFLHGDLAGARELAVKSAQGSLKHLHWVASSLSRREARAIVGASAHRYSLVRLFSSPLDSTAPAPIRFDLAETRRDVANLDLGTAVETNPRIAKLRAEIVSVRGRIGDLGAARPSGERTSEAIADEVSALSAVRDDLERQLKAEIVECGAFIDAIRADEVARGLPPDAVAIGFIRAQGWTQSTAGSIVSRGDILAAHALSPDGSLVEVELGGAEELEELVRSWRAALRTPLVGVGGQEERGGVPIGTAETAGHDLTSLGRALRERILDPLLAELGEEVKTLFVCPADFVHAVALEALPLGDGLVGDRYRIVNEVSFRRFVAPAAPLSIDEEPELLAIGDVAYGAKAGAPAVPLAAVSAQIGPATRSSHVALPGTREEVGGVRALFRETFDRGPSLLMQESATKAAFHELAPGKRFLHVATHGWFKEVEFPEPQPGELWTPLGAGETLSSLAPLSFCGLAFAGANQGRNSLGRVPGILTAEELAGMDLSSCELAVLSACETNVGIRSAGSGIESLQSGLHAAGVRTAITSLWKVDDYWTKELMLEFYRRIWVEGQPKAQALWDSKMAMRARRAETRHWAAWVLSGDPE